MKKIVIVGNESVGSEAIEHLKSLNLEVEFVKSDSEQIEIEGKKYEKIQLRKEIMYGKRPKQRPNVDILLEYQLIKAKKSKLSKDNRDWVEVMFEKNYKEVE